MRVPCVRNCMQVQHGAEASAFPTHAQCNERLQNTQTGRHLLPHQHSADRSVLAARPPTPLAQGPS